MNSNGENFLRIIPREEILDIEEYLTWLENWRSYISTHVMFMESMNDMIDVPEQLWEYEVSSCLR